MKAAAPKVVAAALRVCAGAAALCAATAVMIFGWIVAHRIAYPYDLEWMEGGMLCHALRLSRGQPIYAPPSVDFIPHLYTPLYPALLAALARLSGDVTYLAGRLVSLASFALALGAASLLGASAAREGAQAAAGAGGTAAEGDARIRVLGVAVALAVPVAAFLHVGGFYDLARSDSLQLFLSTAGLTLCWLRRGSHGAVALAAAILCASFFAKQTAAPLIAGTGAALLLTRRPQALTLALCGGALFGVVVLLLDASSGGWFWTYIFRLHQSHAFFTRRAFWETPAQLVAILGPGLLLVPWSLASRGGRAPGLLFCAFLGACGFFAACLSFGTQWAHVNAYIPGVFFPALSMAAAAGHLLSLSGPEPERRRRPARQAAVWLLLCASLLPLLLRYRTDRPAAHVPTAVDRARGDALIARLRVEPGEVLIPFHPFYGHLAGKRTYLHRMGVWDVRGSVAGPVRGLAEALRERRFSAIVFDQKVEWTWDDWPGILSHYQVAERFAGPGVVEGAQTAPALVLRPRPPSPLPAPDMELQ